MTEGEWVLLCGVASSFHADFDIDDWSAHDVFTNYSRPLKPEARDHFYAALEVIVRDHLDEDSHREAWLRAGAYLPPERDEVAAFLAWRRTPEGAKEIASPGPIAISVVASAFIRPG